jgi:hypothetical protein
MTERTSQDSAEELLASILGENSRSEDLERTQRAQAMDTRRSAQLESAAQAQAQRRQRGLERIEAETRRRHERESIRRDYIRNVDALTDPAHLAVDFADDTSTATNPDLERRIREAEIARDLAIAAALAARQSPPQPAPARQLSRTGRLAVAGLFAALVIALAGLTMGTVGASFALSSSDHQPTEYARLELRAQNLDSGVVESGFVAHRKVETQPEARPTRRARGKRRGTRTPKKTLFDFGSSNKDPFSSTLD